jgi:hypothetical protein
MRAKHVVAGLVTIVTAVLGLGMATAGPASASQLPGSWKAYGSTNPIISSSSVWKCGATNDIGGADVLAQACAVRSADGGEIQGAVIVRNNKSVSILTDAAADLEDSSTPPIEQGDWVCSNSGVAAHSWSVSLSA